jgi:hypothetical protein
MSKNLSGVPLKEQELSSESRARLFVIMKMRHNSDKHLTTSQSILHLFFVVRYAIQSVIITHNSTDKNSLSSASLETVNLCIMAISFPINHNYCFFSNVIIDLKKYQQYFDIVSIYDSSICHI